MLYGHAITGAASRALLVAAALLATTLALPSAAITDAVAAPPQSDCGERLRVPGGVDNPDLHGSVPVVLVHGITSSAEMWNTGAADGGRNLAQTLGDIDSTNVWAFDYGDASLKWVNDARIGIALAESIRCLHEQSGNRVILVAHSMGGLAIQWAVSRGGVEEAVAHISTIATPFEGSKSLTMVNRVLDPSTPGPLPTSWRVIAQLLLRTCAQVSQSDLWSICGQAGVLGSPVGRALMEGSDEIAALPPWSAAIPTFRVAGDMDFRPAGTPPSYPVGDIAVAVESALAPGVRDSVPPTVILCQASLPTFQAGRCYHSNLPHDREVIDAIAEQVEPVVDQEADRLWTGSTHAAVSRSTDLVRAGYSMHGEFSFAVGDQGRIHGYARVEYEPFFDASGLNAALDYVEAVGTQTLGIFIPFPIDASRILGFDDLQAVRGEFVRPVAIMEGPITGELGDNLTIAWDGVEQIVLPITVFIDGANGSAVIAREALATESPWLESAPARELDGLLGAVSVTGGRDAEDGVIIASNNTWSAHLAG
jgi:pimeloyl-ACP methyl ester carboxylesterase